LVLTLALGIGATTAIFSVVHAVLFKPLPFADADRLVVLREGRDGVTDVTPASYPEFMDWRDHSGAFDSVGAYFNWGAALTGDSHPEQLYGVRASASLFTMLGVQPVA